MTRKLKTLGAALVAVFALTAVMASAASAAQYTSSVYPTTATGESPKGNDVFTTEAGTVECKAHFVGTLTAASSDLTVTPTYTNCTAFGFVEASVTGCKYTFTAVTTTSSSVHVVNPCTIIASNCHVTVPNQGPLSSVATTNNAAGDVSAKADVSKIHYTVVKDGFLCPFEGTGTTLGSGPGAGTYKQGSAITFDAVSPATASIGVS
jgi:hypothetical protein